MIKTNRTAGAVIYIAIIALVLCLRPPLFAQNTPEQDIALSKLNNFLKSFDGGRYGSVEVKDGTFNIRFKSGNISNFKISDIAEIKILQDNAAGTRVAFMCRDGKKCAYSGHTYSNYESQPFTSSVPVNARELFSLMDNVIKAFQSAKPPAPAVKDTDGDGVVDSEDLCPIEKGTKANKGCADDEAPRSAADIKREREALDSLRSNIEIGRPAEPKPTPAPTPSVSAASVLQNTECSVIVAGKGCGKLALGAAESEIESLLGKPDVVAEGNHRYFAAGIVVRYTSGRTVEQISFIRNSPFRGNNYKPFAGIPDRNVPWQASVPQIKGVYGSPQVHWDTRNLAGVKIDTLTYSNIKFELFEGTLREVEVGNFYKTSAEIAADRKPAPGPLMTKADQIVAEYKTMHDRLERNMSEYNRLAVKYAGEMRLHLSGSAYKTREAMSRIAGESINSIQAFIKKHEGFLAPSIKAHLNEDLQKFLGEP